MAIAPKPDSNAARQRGIDQIDETDAQGLTPARPQGEDERSEREALEKPLGEAKEGGLPGTSPENTSGAGKGHW